MFSNILSSRSLFSNVLSLIIVELLLKIKEEELNSIIVEMRRNCTNLQDKLIKEETEKSVREFFKSVKFQPLKILFQMKCS